MDAIKLYAFYYTNLPPPFEIKVKHKEGIDQMPKEHEV